MNEAFESCVAQRTEIELTLSFSSPVFLWLQTDEEIAKVQA